MVEKSPLAIIQNFFNDTSYKDYIEGVSHYNSRLLIERQMRLPFLDSQTGVAQSSCGLWKPKRQRLPGQLPGQLYTYPAKPWLKRKRQYMMNFMLPKKSREGETVDGEVSNMSMDSSLVSEETRDSTMTQNDSTRDSSWVYYDDLGLDDDMDYDLGDQDSDVDYEDTFKKKKKKGSKPGSKAKPKKKTYDRYELTDAEKPFVCDLCGVRYKTRPGLSYHYTHSHKEPVPRPVEPQPAPPASPVQPLQAQAQLQPQQQQPLLVHPQPHPLQFPHVPPAIQQPTPHQPLPHGLPVAGNMASAPAGMIGPGPNNGMHHTTHLPASSSSSDAQQHPKTSGNDALAGLKRFQDSFLSFLTTPGSGGQQGRVTRQSHPADEARTGSDGNSEDQDGNDNKRATPSTYCDFCLGHATENKKTGLPEELVSCSDCGRSGHPTCLQFTPNMIISVKKYRWQCIECKCCTICGNSDNDDQLLFCDDCDRGYHMYCLSPPLSAPPEGSWSCSLCIKEFHSK